jgi:hypothetical protein
MRAKYFSQRAIVRPKEKKFKDINASFGKMLDQSLRLQPLAYEWAYAKVYGADISILSKAMEEGSF